MKEIKDIVRAYNEATKAELKTALATVVQVEGSSYRRAGARMLVTEEGHLTGAISGGCLEGDALRKALLVMSQQKPMLVTYDTTDEDDAKLGVGLGCNGIIHILIEPVDRSAEVTPITLLQRILESRENAVLCTLFSLEDRNGPQYGTCMLQRANATISSSRLPEALEQTVLYDAKEALEAGASSLKGYGGHTAFIELVKPAVALTILGAGNDALPLVRMAALMGWEISVFDGRPNYPTRARFPEAAKVVVAKPDQVLPQIRLDERTVFVIMTHNYNYDLAILRGLLPLDIPYVGVLGPKSKLNRMLDELKDTGFNVTDGMLAKVYGPVGLEIGAETSEEIALSITAEINAVLTGRSGRPLRLKEGAIHVPS